MQEQQEPQEPKERPTSSRSDTAASPIAVVEAFLDALRAKDVERALVWLSDDIIYQNVPFPADKGRQRVERTLRTLMRIPGKFDIQVHRIAERSGVVMTERTDSTRGSGIDLEFWVCGVFEVHDGKITFWRDYFDLGSFVLKLLMSPVRYLLRARTHAPAT